MATRLDSKVILVSGGAWRADLDQNLTSVFYGLKHQVPAIVAAGGAGLV